MDAIDILLEFDFDLADIKRRLENSERHGVVHAVDVDKKKCRLRIGGTDEEPFLTPWVPYSQVAGDLKIHSPPSVGQQMTFRCPDGDFRQGCVIPYTWSNQNPSPSDRTDEHVTTFGQSKQTIREGQLKQEVGSSQVRVSGERVRAVAPMIDLN